MLASHLVKIVITNIDGLKYFFLLLPTITLVRNMNIESTKKGKLLWILYSFQFWMWGGWIIPPVSLKYIWHFTLYDAIKTCFIFSVTTFWQKTVKMLLKQSARNFGLSFDIFIAFAVVSSSFGTFEGKSPFYHWALDYTESTFIFKIVDNASEIWLKVKRSAYTNNAGCIIKR